MTRKIKIFQAQPIVVQLEIMFYPIFLLFRMPKAWVRTISNSRILLFGRWEAYMGFSPRQAMTNLFYRTQYVNIEKFGVSGKSTVIGMGAFKLTSWFHLSLIGSYAFSRAGAVSTLVGSLVWGLSHFVWIAERPVYWVVSVTLLIVLSSSCYASAFFKQNYQILGWMWLPSALFFSHQGGELLAAVSWIAVGFGGITPILFGVPIAIAFGFLSADPIIAAAIFPALFVCAFRMARTFFCDGDITAFSSIAKMIGLTKGGVRYVRKKPGFNYGPLYFLVPYIISAAILMQEASAYSCFPILGILTFVVNQYLVRVADDQGTIIFASSLFAFTALLSEPTLLAASALWLAVSPMGWALSIQNPLQEKGSERVPVNSHIIEVAPFDHSQVMARIDQFLAPVAKGNRVFFSFEDPAGDYNAIFDGYRTLLEAPLNVCSEKEVHLFPDWWAVMETNRTCGEVIWGRTPGEVAGICDKFSASFAVIYQETGTHLVDVWADGFEKITEFDWCDVLEDYGDLELWDRQLRTPKWFLLKRIK